MQRYEKKEKFIPNFDTTKMFAVELACEVNGAFRFEKWYMKPNVEINKNFKSVKMQLKIISISYLCENFDYKNMRKYFVLSLLALIASPALYAQSAEKTNRPVIIETIEAGKKVTIKQDARIDKLLIERVEKHEDTSDVDEVIVPESYTGPGFRLQVFSSNEQRTAKDDALVVERKLRSSFPGVGVYRVYNSPFWKVRVGDFRSMDEARTFRTNLLKLLPELGREAYTVRENKITIR